MKQRAASLKRSVELVKSFAQVIVEEGRTVEEGDGMVGERREIENGRRETSSSHERRASV